MIRLLWFLQIRKAKLLRKKFLGGRKKREKGDSWVIVVELGPEPSPGNFLLQTHSEIQVKLLISSLYSDSIRFGLHVDSYKPCPLLILSMSHTFQSNDERYDEGQWSQRHGAWGGYIVHHYTYTLSSCILLRRMEE